MSYFGQKTLRLTYPGRSSKMNIQIAYLADYPHFVPQIAAWTYDEWGRHYPGNSVQKACDSLNAKLNHDHAPIPIVALAEAQPVGTSQLKIREMEQFPDYEYWLGDVYVASRVRGQGIGELLVKRIEEISQQLGIQELYLQTEMLTGGLYARLGWLPLEQVDNNGLRVVIMRKDLHT